MLDLTKIQGVGVDTSTNKTVQNIWAAAQRYNLLARRAGGNTAELAQQLQKVMYYTTLYITSKPPSSGKARIVDRWEALVNLAEQASQEAARLKVKMIHGENFNTLAVDDPGVRKDESWQKANSCFWLEVVDPEHRHGMTLSKAFEEWGTNDVCIQQKMSFWDYCQTNLAREPVTYLDIARHGVHFKGGKLVDSADQLVNNERFLRDEEMIFVCDLDWNLYLHKPTAGVFHHSSFLAGNPVRCAGEMKVEAGVIFEVTSNTGHYRTTPELMREFIKYFWQIPDKAWITPNMASGKQYVCGPYRKYGEDERALVNYDKDKGPQKAPVKPAPAAEKKPTKPAASNAEKKPAKV